MISFSGDLWPSLGGIGITLGVAAILVGVVAWRGRRRKSRTLVLDAAFAISGWWVALSAISAIIIVVKVFSVDWAELHGPNSLWVSWPEDLPCSDFGAAHMLTCSNSNVSEFTVGGASLGLRMLAGAAQLFLLALTTVPAAMFAVICFQTLLGRPFSRTLIRVLNGGAVAVLVLGIGSDLLGGIAAATALREVFSAESPWYPYAFQLTVTPLPFVGALALAALAAVFRQGFQLQGERDALQRETEGLV